LCCFLPVTCLEDFLYLCSWKSSFVVASSLEDENKGCDVEKVKTEHDEFGEEELQNHQAQF
jgi:hypothetical protein